MSEKVRDYPRLAKDIIRLVGGEKNVVGVSRCATRLRLVLSDTPSDAKAAISELPGVITVVESGGQFQVVIGTHVGAVYDQVALDLDLENNPRAGEAKSSVLNQIIATMSASIAPFVYILAAAGILQGCLILTNMAWDGFDETGTYEVFSFISWTPFVFLPVLIAIGASKHFKANTYIAVTIAAALINPDWGAIAGRVAGGEAISFFGIPLNQTTYTATVLPAIFMVWLLAYLERWLESHLPNGIKALLTPFFCMAIMVPLTLLVLGPVTTWLANGMADLYNNLYDLAPVVAAAFVGFFLQVLVVFGVHWAMMPIGLANQEAMGFDTFQVAQTAAVIGQIGAVAGVLIRSRNKELRGVAGAAGLTGFFGITEPAVYGVTLRLKSPFIAGCIAGSVGAVVMSIFGTKYYSFAGLPGPLTIINAYSSDDKGSLMGMLIGSAVAFVGGIVMVNILQFKDPVADLGTSTAPADHKLTLEAYNAMIVDGGTATRLGSPLDGRVIALDKVADPVFGSGAMGAGVAIEPSGTTLYSPFDGVVSLIFRTKHAIGMTNADGLELLIHVGMDTVQLDGQHFTALVEQGQTVARGEALLEFDAAAIKAAGFSLITPMVVTNLGDHAELLPYPTTEITHGAEIAAVVVAAPTSA